MRVNFAHLRGRAQAGGCVSFAAFDKRTAAGTSADNSNLLAQQTVRARAPSVHIDQAALALMSRGRLRFLGGALLVVYLSRSGLPGWTHTLTV